MSDPHPATPDPGWYPDSHGDQRWWDGHQWTDRTLPPPPGPGTPTPATTATATATSSGGATRAVLVGFLVLGVVLLIALAVLNVVLVTQ